MHRKWTLAPVAPLVVVSALALGPHLDLGAQAQGGAPGQVTPVPRDRPAAVSTSPTGSIRGRIVRADTGAPVPYARVAVAGSGSGRALTSGGTPPPVVADEEGRYVISGLFPGHYSVVASKSGFVTTVFGQRNARVRAGTTIELAERQAVGGVDVALFPGAVIEGRVLDQFGEAAAGARVQVMRRQYQNGQRRMVPAGGQGGMTDDLGRFRVYGLAAGSYYLASSVSPYNDLSPGGPPGSVTSGAAPTYYPGTPSAAEAQPLTLATGQELSGLLLQAVPVPLAAIRGRVTSRDGRPLGGEQIELNTDTLSLGTSLQADGSFAYTSLPPGQYTVSINPGGRDGVIRRVTLTGEDVTLTLVSSTLPIATGRVRFDSGAPPADMNPGTMRVEMPSLDTGRPRAATGFVRDDWTFEIWGVSGSHLVRVPPSGGWSLKQVLRDGQDVTDTPFDVQDQDIGGLEIVLTRRATQIAGRVLSRTSTPQAGITVVVFADDPERWGPHSRFVQATATSRDGGFRITGLPAGRYLVATKELEPGEERDPDVLETLRRSATPLTLNEGETRTLELTMAAAP